jgi:hypothetical protein
MKINKLIAKNKIEFLNYFNRKNSLSFNLRLLSTVIKGFITGVVGGVLKLPLIVTIIIAGLLGFNDNTPIERLLNKFARKRFFKKYKISKKSNKTLKKAVKEYSSVKLSKDKNLFNEIIKPFKKENK